MAYDQRHRAPQRPYYGHQESSHESSYTTGYDYDGNDQNWGYDAQSRRGPQGQYHGHFNHHGQNHDRPDYKGNGIEEHNGLHAGSGHDRGWDKQPVDRRQQRPLEAGSSANQDHGTHENPHPNSRHAQNPQYQQREQRQRPQERHAPHHQQNRPKVSSGSSRQYDHAFSDGYGYEEKHQEPQNDWQSTQHYESSPGESGAQYQHTQNYNFPQQHGYSDEYGQEVSQRRHQNLPTVKAIEPGLPPPPQSQPQIRAVRQGKIEYTKPNNKMIGDKIKSPDTLAWDNPFPTFPTKPKANTPPDNKSLSGSVGATTPNAQARLEKKPNSPPPSASGYHSSSRKDKANVTAPAFQSQFPHPAQTVAEIANNFTAPPNGSADQPRSQRAGYGFDNPMQTEPRNYDDGPRTHHLKATVVKNRHSEDNRTRPVLLEGPLSRSEYERSRTMPAAISEAAVESNHQARRTDHLDWQNLGPVAGYYGPGDRDYLPTRPDPTHHKRPVVQPRSQSDDARVHISNARAPPAVTYPQRHTPHDSPGHVFDTSFETTPPDQNRPARKGQPRHYASIDEDMPNFDAILDTAPTRTRGPTTDDHLQPQLEFPMPPPMPAPPQDQARRGPKYEPYRNEPIPRSRSQPDLKDRRSPKPQHVNDFDFGIPGSAEPRYATAVPRDLGVGSRQQRYQPSRSDAYRRPTESEYSMDRRHEPHEPGDAIPKDDAWPNRYRSPPLRNGQPPSEFSGPNPMPHYIGGDPDRFRSLLQNGRPRNDVHDPTATEYQNDSQPDQYRSPLLQNGRPRESPIVQPGDRTSPANQRGPTSSPKQPPSNPDALPHHPAPIRPGLMEGSIVNPAPRPAPVRQYHGEYNPASSPPQLYNPTQQPASSRLSDDKRGSGPVTYEELERLRQTTIKTPSNQAVQLTLAKKLAEAAAVLVDERADQRTRTKTREKYVMDSCKIVKKLSGNGYSEAMFYLGDCYSRGALGLESDIKEAFNLYQSAAKAGHAQAAYRVAVCCELGQEDGGGTRRDAVKAMQWYKRAATLGDTPAMYKMGIIQLKGLLGQRRSLTEAMVYLKNAAERADKENPHALHELALLHENSIGNEGIKQDEAYSKQLFAQAANLGYKFSQFRLGCAYEFGQVGCPIDPRQSIAWYSKAAVQEEHQSELALSGWYLTGSEGVLQQSDTEAYLWARKAAQAGLAKAEYAMGYLTEVGIGAPASIEDAKRWYWRSASQNFPRARERLEDLRRGGATKQKTRVSRSAMKKQSDGECIIM